MSNETLNEKLARFELTISELKKEVAKLSNVKAVVDPDLTELKKEVAKLSNIKPIINNSTVKEEIESTVTKKYITNLYRG